MNKIYPFDNFFSSTTFNSAIRQTLALPNIPAIWYSVAHKGLMEKIFIHKILTNGFISVKLLSYAVTTEDYVMTNQCTVQLETLTVILFGDLPDHF